MIAPYPPEIDVLLAGCPVGDPGYDDYAPDRPVDDYSRDFLQLVSAALPRWDDLVEPIAAMVIDLIRERKKGASRVANSGY